MTRAGVGNQTEPGDIPARALEITVSTIAYFEAVRAINQKKAPPAHIAFAAFRFALALALDHPEYARAYHSLTSGVAEEADNIEPSVVDDFVQRIPIELASEAQEASA